LAIFTLSNGINKVINDSAGKMLTNKARVAGDNCSHFKNHDVVRDNFILQQCSPF